MYGYGLGYSGHGGYLRNLALSRPGANQICIFQAHYYTETAVLPFDQFARLAAGSSCLGDGYFSLDRMEGDGYTPTLESEMYEIDLGLPASDLIRTTAFGDTLYERAFTKGFVQVNPNNATRLGVPPRDALFTFYEPPTAIAVDPRADRAMIRWRVPEIDGSSELISGFEIRIATFPINDATWEDAVALRTLNHVGLWQPGDAIEAEAVNLSASTVYHTAARTIFRGEYRSSVSPSFRFVTLSSAAGWTPPEGAGTSGNDFWWTAFAGHAPNGPVHTILPLGSELVVGGAFTHLAGSSARNIGRWDGSTWRSFGGGVNGPVLALTTWSGHLIAGGEFSAAGSEIAAGVAAWDGREWMPMGEGFDGPVRALTIWRGQIIAAGPFSRSGTRPLNGIAAWSGDAWVPIGFATNEGLALATAPILSEWDDGILTQATIVDEGATHDAVVTWHGASWETLGSPIDGHITALGVDAGDLIVGGEFHSIDGLATNNLARWDGESWYPLGAGVNGRVDAISSYGEWLIVGGNFLSSAGESTPYIARWDGTAFTPLGTGMDAPVHTLTRHGDHLFVGGAFTHAGDRSSPFIARWNQTSETTPIDPGDDPPVLVVTHPQLLAPKPNPFGSTTRIEYALPASLPVAFRVFDIQGQLVTTLFEGVHPAGTFVRTWDGRSSGGDAIPPGVYFLRLEAPSFTLTQKLVRSR
jgi:hypothetical protein